MSKKGFFARRVTAMACTAALLASSIPLSWVQAVAYDNNPVKIPQFLMTATASSEESSSDTCYASLAIDGDSGTMWHTRWSTSASAPHWISVDLGRNVELTKLTYLPRQDGNSNGYIREYAISVSADGNTYTPIAEGSWESDMTEKEAVFSAPVSARYVRLEAVNASMASCAELNFFAAESVYAPLWDQLDNAYEAIGQAEAGEEIGQYPQEQIDLFQQAIDEAELQAASLPESDEAAIQAAADTLSAAMHAFEESRNMYGRDDLETLLGESQSLLDGTGTGTENGQASEEAKNAFAAAIQEADAVFQDQAANKTQIHSAYEALDSAVAVFQDHIVTDQKSLAGVWELKLGSYSPEDGTLSDTCILPGTLDENKKGNRNTSVNTNHLNRKYTYTGDAVYQKKVFIPENWAGKHVTFLMERTKNTQVWVNGQEQTNYNSNDTLGTAQEYVLSGLIPGQENTITVQVRNTDYQVGTNSHMLTEETVTNWNGILGKIELKAVDPVFIQDVRIYPDIHAKTALAKITLSNTTGQAVNGNLTLQAHSYNHEGDVHTVPQAVQEFSLAADETEKEIEVTYAMGDDVRLWSEFDPSMYEMTISLDAEGMYSDTFVENFGMREFKTSGTKFTINGTTTFMRGEGNSAVFPLTGYPFMTKEEWLDFFSTAQELGINFFRFHSWTPPEAAFEAADELGIYMQPELYGFGGTPFGDYFNEEAVRILEYLANHPSFVMFAWGNELNTTGSNRDGANALRELCRSVDDTRLYAEGSNNNYWAPSLNEGDDYWTTCKTRANSDPYHTRISFSWVDAASGGALESMQPNTTFTYQHAIEEVDKPLMNHEAGQYQVLPLFDEEIPKYESGVFEARNLQYYRDLMESKGLLHMNEIFSKVSARVSAIGYRADMETALRTPDMAGYQLLSIQDFPGQGTAHVGILDNFMEDKPGGFTKEQYKSFNDSVVVLAQLPKLVLTNSEDLTGTISVVNYGPAALDGVVGQWKLTNGDTVLAEGTLDATDVAQGGVTEIGAFTTSLAGVTEAAKLKLEVSVDSIGSNSYDLWVYPSDLNPTVPSDVLVSTNMDQATLQALENGQKVLFLPEPSLKTIPDSVAVRWTTDYWSKMFHRSDRDAHTMGMYVQNDHPIFRYFPTEYFNDYQWFNLMKGSRAVVLDDAPADLEPLAWNIDHMEWSRKLGSLFEANVGAGKLVVCTFDLLNQMEEYPEAKQLYYSILQYMASDEFQPEAELTPEYLTQTFVEKTNVDPYETIEAESYAESSGNLWTESGTGETGEPETALGGITSGNWVLYEDVDFGLNGCAKITINGSNNNSYSQIIDVRLDSPTGELVTTLEFQPTGSWSEYKSQTFDIPRISGLHDLVLVFQNGSIALNSFWFEEGTVQYISPYEQINPESAAGDIEITDIDGGSHVIMQNYVSAITDQVEIKFNNVEFGSYGSKEVTIQGRSLNGEDVYGYLRYNDNGTEKTIPFVFKAGEGESYELSSETFFKQTVPAKGIMGPQDLVIGFEKGTSFDFEALVFTGYDSAPVVNEDYENAMQEAADITAKVENRPLLYTEETWKIFEAAYESASAVDIYDNDAVAEAAEQLQAAIDGLVLTGRSKSAYTTTYARNYDSVDGSVNLERGEPDQVVGGFDKGEILYYDGLDFGSTGASKLTVRVANGRADTEEEKEALLRFRFGEGDNEFVDVRIAQTGGWDAAHDQDFTVEIPSSLWNGVKDVSIELVEGAVAFHSFTFEKTENTEPQLLTVQWSGNASMSVEGEAEEIISTDAIYGAKVQPGEELTFTFTPTKGAFSGAQLNGEDIKFAADGCTYTFTMPGESTTLRFTFTSVDKSILGIVLEEANAVPQDVIDSLVPSAKEFFENALAKAQEVYDDADATEEEVKEVWSDLLDAMHLLEFEAGDKETLLPLINIAEQLKDMLDQFKPGTTEGFEESLDAAKDVYAEEDALKADVDEAYDNLQAAIDKLEMRADMSILQNTVNEANGLDLNSYIDDEAMAAFKTVLAEAEELLLNADAEQADVDAKAVELSNAMAALRKIPNKDELNKLIAEMEQKDLDGYTDRSVAAFKAALSVAKTVAADANADEQAVAKAYTNLEAAANNLVKAEKPGTGNSGKGSTSANVGNAYGVAGVVSAAQGVTSQKAYVVSDTTVNFTLKRGSAYCFKMTVVNGNAMTPSFTVGNGDVLKTQFVAKIGNDYYYRVYATGTPGQSTGVYTTLPGNVAVKHCTVTIG